MDSSVGKRMVPSRDDQQVGGIDTAWYWVMFWVPKQQQAQWAPGYWTGNKWVFPGFGCDGVGRSSFIRRGAQIFPPSTSLGAGCGTGAYWWYTTNAQPDTWMIGFGQGNGFLWGESYPDFISLNDIAKTGDGPLPLDAGQVAVLDTGWYWVKFWIPDRQQAQWSVGQWTGSEWVFPGIDADAVAKSPMIDFGMVLIDPPSTGVTPPPTVGDSLYCWYKAKAQPNTWVIGWGCGDHFLGGESALDTISLDDIAVVGPEPLTAPTY